MPRISKLLNISTKPGVGMSYVAIDREESAKQGKTIYVHCSTTCRRDTNPAKGGREDLAPLTGYSAAEPFFKAKFGKKPNFQYVTFLCGQQHEKCLSEDGRYEWTEQPLKGAPADWEIIHAKQINAAFLPPKAVKVKKTKVETPVVEATAVEVEVKTTPAMVLSAAKKAGKAKTKTKTPAKVKTPAKAIKAEAKSTAKKKVTWYAKQDGKVVSKRCVNQPEGYVTSREAAEAL